MVGKHVSSLEGIQWGTASVPIAVSAEGHFITFFRGFHFLGIPFVFCHRVFCYPWGQRTPGVSIMMNVGGKTRGLPL
jgi:hypothetical protein